jgi:hypothetical protein
MTSSLNFSPYSLVPSSVLVDARECQHYVGDMRAGRAYEAGRQQKGNIVDHQDGEELEMEGEPQQNFISLGSLGALGSLAGTIGIGVVKHVLPKFVDWFKQHQGKVHTNIEPPKLTSNEIKLLLCKASQYVIPAVGGALIVWYVLDPGGNARLVIMGFGWALQYLVTLQGNKEAKTITEAEKKWIQNTVGGQAFNLGVATCYPEIAADAGFSPDEWQTLFNQAQAPSIPWYKRIFSCCGEQKIEQKPEKSWCQKFTDCLCCCDIWRKSVKNEEPV